MTLCRLRQKLFLLIHVKENILGFFKMGQTPCFKSGTSFKIGVILKRSLSQSKISTTVGSSATVSLVETRVGGWRCLFEPYQIFTETLSSTGPMVRL